MKIHIISGKNARVEKNSVEASHLTPSGQSEEVFTGQKIMIEKEEYLLLTHRETQYSIAVKTLCVRIVVVPYKIKYPMRVTGGRQYGLYKKN